MLCLQEPGRLFCPHCGNATLEKVEMIVGADGEEQFGVRKRHNLRGTRFPLPKPRVGAGVSLTPSIAEAACISCACLLPKPLVGRSFVRCTGIAARCPLLKLVGVAAATVRVPLGNSHSLPMPQVCAGSAGH